MKNVKLTTNGKIFDTIFSTTTKINEGLEGVDPNSRLSSNFYHITFAPTAPRASPFNKCFMTRLIRGKADFGSLSVHVVGTVKHRSPDLDPSCFHPQH